MAKAINDCFCHPSKNFKEIFDCFEILPNGETSYRLKESGGFAFLFVLIHIAVGEMIYFFDAGFLRAAGCVAIGD